MPQNIDLLEENDLQALVDNQVPESKTIDYKESLPGNPDSDRKEFLADVWSFANASGGHLIYGILVHSILHQDSTYLRLQQIPGDFSQYQQEVRNLIGALQSL